MLLRQIARDLYSRSEVYVAIREQKVLGMESGPTETAGIRERSNLGNLLRTTSIGNQLATQRISHFIHL